MYGNTVSIKMTVNQAVDLVNFLQEQYDGEKWQVDREYDSEKELSEYQVTSAERALEKRKRISDMISSITGREHGPDKYAASITKLRYQYDNQLLNTEDETEADVISIDRGE